MDTENRENKKNKENEDLQAKVVKITIDMEKIRQTKAFAGQDGAFLGLVWIASFACTMLSANKEAQTLGLVANILLIATPFIVAKRLKRFRDVVRDGHISFRHGLYYCVKTFFYATLLLTLVQYLWFSYLDTGVFMSQLEASYQMVAKAYRLTAQESQTLIDAITMMSPIAWASMFMITDLAVGAVLSPIIAATVSRKAKK